VNDRVRRLVLVVEALIDRKIDEGLAGDGVPHLQAFGKHGPFAHLGGEAEVLEHAEHVGTELDPGADLFELVGLLDDVRRNALARQGERGAKPADAAADNQHGRFLSVSTHDADSGNTRTFLAAL
jgi:hypothetical protein